METKNHLALAQYLIATTDNPDLKKWKKAFLLGNVMPDINVFTYLHGGHTFTKFFVLQEKLWPLMEKSQWNMSDVYQLGIMTHYIADGFTFPHNRQFQGTLTEHYRYEKQLEEVFTAYLKNSVQKLSDHCRTRKDQLVSYIETKHQEYLKRHTSWWDDCDYILSICTDLLLSLHYFMEQNKIADIPVITTLEPKIKPA